MAEEKFYPPRLAMALAPGGLAFQHYLKEELFIERRVAGTERAYTEVYADHDARQMREAAMRVHALLGRDIATLIYDGDSGELLGDPILAEELLERLEQDQADALSRLGL